MPSKDQTPHPVRQIRRSLNPDYRVTQQVLANMVGCTRETINRIELGKVELSADIAKRIDSALGSELFVWLVEGTPNSGFRLNRENLIRKFKAIRDFEAQQVWHIDVVKRPLLRHELASIIGEEELEKHEDELLRSSEEVFFKALDELHEKLSAVDVSFEKKARLCRALLAGNSLESVFADELGALEELFVIAFEAHKYPAVQWSFVQWLINTLREFDLETKRAELKDKVAPYGRFASSLSAVIEHRYVDGFGTFIDFSEGSKHLIDGKVVSGRYSKLEWEYVYNRFHSSDSESLVQDER